MFLSRLDTQKVVNTKDLGYPKDSFVVSGTVELEWDEKRGVVAIRAIGPASQQRRVAALVPLENVAFMWPLDE